MINKLYHLLVLILLCFLTACSREEVNNENTLFTTPGGKLLTLDPILASDLVSRDMVAEFYDTLLEYDYYTKPYKLKASMLDSMPEVNETFTEYKFKLRDDLYFVKDKCFSTDDMTERKITSNDIVFSFMRLADARNYSPGYWILRGNIKGLDDFWHNSKKFRDGDLSNYDSLPLGFEILNDREFIIKLTKPDPRFLYMLAMPYTSIVSRRAVEYYRDDFHNHPVGSGPFILSKWRKNHSLVLYRNGDYREEYIMINSKKMRLPILDRVVCYLVEQPLSSWLMFLNGELDYISLGKDNFDAVINKELKLIKPLQDMKVKLKQLPTFQVNYIGFSFSSQALSNNLYLRKAISLAYNTNKRVKFSNYRLIPANGPIPPGVAGYDPKFINPYSTYDIGLAKELLSKAGYPMGIDPKTGKPLVLTFDMGSTSSQARQLAEMFVIDMKKIGIEVKPFLNNKSRFNQKLRNGNIQIFKYSWIGDYPDAENFLQLFYSKNAGGCNRASYSDPIYDKMFEEVAIMPDSKERTQKYKAMVQYLAKNCPWIFESYPVSYSLEHYWLKNNIPHDFAFNRWKYIYVDQKTKRSLKQTFKPVSMSELRGN
jgi:ABC-type oligopeptide transport system substrate-binding subunit